MASNICGSRAHIRLHTAAPVDVGIGCRRVRHGDYDAIA